jgi:hypothetical protein
MTDTYNSVYSVQKDCFGQRFLEFPFRLILWRDIAGQWKFRYNLLQTYCVQ